MKDIAGRLRDEAEHAERHMDAHERPGTLVRRPGGQRARVLSVRLSDEESQALDAAAERAGVSASALVRTWIADHLASDEETTDLHDLALTLRSVSRRLDLLGADPSPVGRRRSA